jgi:hypothetical protein
VRVDDWNEDRGEEHDEAWAAPTAPADPAPVPAPAAEAGETAPAARPRPPLSATLPIYIIGIVSISTICLMFAIIMALIITR